MGGTLKKNDYDPASNNNFRNVGMSPILIPSHFSCIVKKYKTE
jgi:hypothetical protein